MVPDPLYDNTATEDPHNEDKTTTLIQGTGSSCKSNAVIINESGLYSLILSSKLESAKQFKHWVTAEVLPQIRKMGGYGEMQPMTDVEIMAMPRTGRTPIANPMESCTPGPI